MGLYAFTLFCVTQFDQDHPLPNPYAIHEAAFTSLCSLLYNPEYWWDTVVEMTH